MATVKKTTASKAPVRKTVVAAKKTVAKKAPVAAKRRVAAAPEAPVKRGGFPARKPGTAARPKRKPLPTFKAPADFKPHDLLVQVKTERDGLIATQVKATRFQGRFDREADDKKKFDLGSYDSNTLMGVAARIAGVTFKPTNDKKMPVIPRERDGLKGSNRLPASTTFQIRIRAGRKMADNTLTARVVQIWQAVPKNTGRLALRELEKTDPAYRLIRKVSRLLPAAFTECQMPPKRGRARKADEDTDD
jgi:hypothetical protein